MSVLAPGPDSITEDTVKAVSANEVLPLFPPTPPFRDRPRTWAHVVLTGVSGWTLHGSSLVHALGHLILDSQTSLGPEEVRASCVAVESKCVKMP